MVPQVSLPTGVVTFLLTDVEGSTRLWRQVPHAAALMARQAELIAEAVACHRGVRPLEQGEGDSVVAAFARPTDALAAALAAQRALQGETWPDELPVRVRMAVHTGEAELVDDHTYGGEAIIRCARIRALARGGCVLVSSITAALTSDHLPPAATLDELQACKLDGFDRPERVHQLRHPEIELSQSPLRQSPLSRLPQWPTSLIGRDHERAEVASLVATARLVTITGAGGSGKTRLAHAVAGDLGARWKDGVVWIELATVSNGSQLAGTVAAACGVREIPGASVEEVLTRHLAKAELLLVLDNCEHLLGDLAALVESILRGTSDVTVLATSREPLGVSGEATWRIPSLAIPGLDVLDIEQLRDFDAVRLLAERSRAARPDFSLDAGSAPAVVRICRRLDGIPLALELAAARLRSLSLRQLADGLDDRFRLLTGGARTAMARQRTLLASVEWSHDLLDEEERTVFRRLGVFVSPFTLEAAEAVAADDQIDRLAVFDVLARLVDKSLVQHAGERYALLETLRQYAVERARDAGELAAQRDRHLAWFRRRAAGWNLDREVATEPVLDEIAGDAPNLIAAIEWSLSSDCGPALEVLYALGAYWENRHGHSECCAIARAVLAQLHEGSRPWLEALAPIARALFYAGEIGWVPAARQALDEARHEVDAAVAGKVELGVSLGIGLFPGGRSEGVERLRRAIEAGRDAANRALELDATIYLAFSLASSGDQAGARPLLRWLDRHAPPDLALRPLLEQVHAVAAIYDGDFERARACMRAQIELLHDVRSFGLIANIVSVWRTPSGGRHDA